MQQIDLSGMESSMIDDTLHQWFSSNLQNIRFSNFISSRILSFDFRDSEMDADMVRLLVDLEIIHNGLTYRFYGISSELEDRGDDRDLGGQYRYFNISFKAL